MFKFEVNDVVYIKGDQDKVEHTVTKRDVGVFDNCYWLFSEYDGVTIIMEEYMIELVEEPEENLRKELSSEWT
jgi:hypothetical protein